SAPWVPGWTLPLQDSSVVPWRAASELCRDSQRPARGARQGNSVGVDLGGRLRHERFEQALEVIEVVHDALCAKVSVPICEQRIWKAVYPEKEGQFAVDDARETA